MRFTKPTSSIHWMHDWKQANCHVVICGLNASKSRKLKQSDWWRHSRLEKRNCYRTAYLAHHSLSPVLVYNLSRLEQGCLKAARWNATAWNALEGSTGFLLCHKPTPTVPTVPFRSTWQSTKSQETQGLTQYPQAMIGKFRTGGEHYVLIEHADRVAIFRACLTVLAASAAVSRCVPQELAEVHINHTWHQMVSLTQ